MWVNAKKIDFYTFIREEAAIRDNAVMKMVMVINKMEQQQH